MIQANFTVSPSSGDVYATEFTFVNTTSSSLALRHLVWDFGDNTDLIYDVSSPTHIYQYPGTYVVSITSANTNGETSIYRNSVIADLPYRDYVLFTQIPDEYANPGKKTKTPFKVKALTTQLDKPIVLDLFCINSNSIPYEYVPERWSFLNPTWKFTDSNNTFINSLSVDSKPVYKNGYLVGLSGEAEFYFIDSTSTGDPSINCPVILTCTLQTSGFFNPLESNIYPYPTYANNKNVKAVLTWYVNNTQPNLLKITSNYLEDMYPRYWQDTKIPFIITAHYDRANELSGVNSNISEIVFTYPQNNVLELTTPVSASLTNLLSTEYIFDEAPLYFQLINNEDFRVGGYIFTTVTPLQTATTSTILASAIKQPLPSLQDQIGAALPNVFALVSNPELNTINKILFTPVNSQCTELVDYRNRGILSNGFVQEISVPSNTSDSTFNYNMSGFSGIYSIAIEPINYNFYACDAELDKLYKFTSSGTLLCSLDLKNFDTPILNAFTHWRWSIETPLLSTNSYYFGNDIYLSENQNNYIVSVGGLIQSQDAFYIDARNRTVQLLTSATIPGSSTHIDVVQIFNPLLPYKYFSTLNHWTTSSEIITDTFYLAGTQNLSADTTYYIVSIDGILQSPDSYVINNVFRTIKFDDPVPNNALVLVTYLPELQSPAYWSFNLTTPTTALPLTGNSNYTSSANTNFLVNVGGVYQPAINYYHDYSNSQLIFTDVLPAGVPIIITQTFISDIIDVPSAFTPSSISIDKNLDIWVTFFNNLSVVKFNSNLDLLFITAPNLPIPIERQFDGDFLLKPSIAETDKNSDCWVTYAHPLCSSLVKYSSGGNIITQINLDNYSVPVGLALDDENNIWVANIYNVLSATGNIQLYDSNNYTLLKSITGIPRPSYIAVDIQNNLWFTHSINGVGYYNTQQDILSTWTFNEANELLPITQQDLSSVPEIFVNDEEHGGLGIDLFNRVWVINSYRNTVNVLLTADSTITNTNIYTFKILPNTSIGYYIDVNTGATITESDSTYQYRSAQANGDWTGIKWYKKYFTGRQDTKIIAGESTPFTIYELKNTNEIRRVNESFNTSDYYKSLALPEVLKSNSRLWNKFFAAVVGTGEISTSEDLGQITYERIANFLDNHTDIDTCNIDQLLSLAKETNVFAADYGSEIPAEIKRMLDIGSVSKSKLWGIPDNQVNLATSLGIELNPYTDSLTAGEQIVLKSKLDNTYSLITVPEYENNSIYPITSFNGYGFAPPVILNYQFFIYEPQYSGKFIENLIDWESTFTTLNSTVSTFNEWYGENGILETTFNYLLTKNLFLK